MAASEGIWVAIDNWQGGQTANPGAVATGTHGTGRLLQNMSASVVGLRLVLADGQVVDCNSDIEPDLFSVDRHSLGSIGVTTEATLLVRDRYRLEERLWTEDPDVVMKSIGQLSAGTLRVLLDARQRSLCM